MSRRHYLAAFTDAVMAYWLNGTHDEDMLEWWTTDEAVDACTEMFGAFITVCDERGLPLPWHGEQDAE